MVKRWQKALFYRLANPFMWVNGRIYRFLRASKGGLKVHLGCGQKNYLPGWVNVDANIFTAKIDLWANILHPLPFRNGSVVAFYSHHVLEHIPYDRVVPILTEMFRCLEVNGIVRIGAPYVGNAARAYVAGRADWFGDLPRAHESLGGKFSNFVLCAGEHLQMFDYSFLLELLQIVGFSSIRELLPGQTENSGIFDDTVLDTESEWTPELPHTLIVEAIKSG